MVGEVWVGAAGVAAGVEKKVGIGNVVAEVAVVAIEVG